MQISGIPKTMKGIETFLNSLKQTGHRDLYIDHNLIKHLNSANEENLCSKIKKFLAKKDIDDYKFIADLILYMSCFHPKIFEIFLLGVYPAFTFQFLVASGQIQQHLMAYSKFNCKIGHIASYFLNRSNIISNSHFSTSRFLCGHSSTYDPLLVAIFDDNLDELAALFHRDNDLSFNAKISHSSYRIEDFLPINPHYSPTLVEYACLFGSLKASRFLMINDCLLTPNLYAFSIYGRNKDIMKKTKQISSPQPIDKQCVTLSIIAHQYKVTEKILQTYLYQGRDFLDFLELSITCYNLKTTLFLFASNDFAALQDAEQIKGFLFTSTIDFLSLSRLFYASNPDWMDMVDDDGNSPLHIATKYDCANLVTYFLFLNSDINLKNKLNETPMKIAVIRKYYQIMNILIDNGADTETEDYNGNRPLHIAAENGMRGMAEKLIEKGCDKEARNQYGQTALLIAIEKGDMQMFKLLVDLGCDIHACDNGMKTALHYAAKYGRDDIAEYLIENDFDLESVDKNGNTPLHIACFHNNPGVIKLLMMAGADIYRKNNRKEKPLDLSYRDESEKAIDDILEFFKNVQKEARDSKGNTMFLNACQCENFSYIKFLVSNGCEIDVRNNDGKGALHYLAERGEFRSFQFILESGCDFDKRDNDGRTPLHVAVANNQIEMVKMLVAKGCNRKIKDNLGGTPLDLAIYLENEEIIKFLYEIESKRRYKGY